MPCGLAGSRASQWDAVCHQQKLRRPPQRCAARCLAEERHVCSPLDTWLHTAQLPDGEALVVRPAATTDLAAVVALLADAYATSLQAQQFRPFLQRQVTSYCAARLQMPRHQAALLVAATAPAEPGQLVAVCEVSVSPRTRSFADKRLAPPPHGVYICNVNVLPTHRRRGIGTAVLAAAQAFSVDAVDCSHNQQHEPAALLPGTHGEADAFASFPLDVFLHCVLGDAAAHHLYSSAGFATVAQHAPWELPILRQGAPRLRLMKKRLRERRRVGCDGAHDGSAG